MDELIQRLRSDSKALFSAGWVKTSDLAREAADAIEELDADLERSKEWECFWKEQAEEAKGKLQQYALAVANKPRWIPVTERLPEDRRDVLVYAGVMFPYITVGYYDELWKFSYNDEEIAGSADYWMPLPPAPKEE